MKGKGERRREKEKLGSRDEQRTARVKMRDSKFEKRDLAKNLPLTTNHLPIIYGVLPVLEALRAGNRRIEKILIADSAREKRLNEIFQLARENGVLLQKVPRENLSRFVETGANHQSVIAFIASADYYDSERLLNEIYQKNQTEEKPLIVVLDGIEDPRNLGAILRAVECAGADGVFIPERRAVGLTETVVKSSAGATEYVKVTKITNINRLIDELKENNIWVVGASGEAEMNYADWDWRQPSALVLGSEGKVCIASSPKSAMRW